MRPAGRSAGKHAISKVIDLVQPGLYEQLLTTALQQELDDLADPRLYALAAVEPDDAHNVLAQYLEHLLANALASFRGAEATERQQRLVQRILETLIEELNNDWTQQISIATPLQRLLAVHATV